MNGDLGLLWEMDAKVDLDGNVARAMAYHEKKYGQAATLANANPSDLAEAKMMNGILVTPEKSCLKGYLFVGRRME